MSEQLPATRQNITRSLPSAKALDQKLASKGSPLAGFALISFIAAGVLALSSKDDEETPQNKKWQSNNEWEEGLVGCKWLADGIHDLGIRLIYDEQSEPCYEISIYSNKGYSYKIAEFEIDISKDDIRVMIDEWCHDNFGPFRSTDFADWRAQVAYFIHAAIIRANEKHFPEKPVNVEPQPSIEEIVPKAAPFEWKVEHITHAIGNSWILRVSGRQPLTIRRISNTELKTGDDTIVTKDNFKNYLSKYFAAYDAVYKYSDELFDTYIRELHTVDLKEIKNRVGESKADFHFTDDSCFVVSRNADGTINIGDSPTNQNLTMAGFVNRMQEIYSKDHHLHKFPEYYYHVFMDYLKAPEKEATDPWVPESIEYEAAHNHWKIRFSNGNIVAVRRETKDEIMFGGWGVFNKDQLIELLRKNYSSNHVFYKHAGEFFDTVCKLLPWEKHYATSDTGSSNGTKWVKFSWAGTFTVKKTDSPDKIQWMYPGLDNPVVDKAGLKQALRKVWGENSSFDKLSDYYFETIRAELNKT